jgi:DNA polymerase III alpha subunit
VTGVQTCALPIFHGLIFERFLHPSRKSPPDIDIDFDANRRDEVINYIKRDSEKQLILLSAEII